MNVNWLFSKCRRFESEISLLAAGMLGSEDEARVREHVTRCANCRARLAALESLAQGLARLAALPADFEPPSALRHRWRQLIETDSQPSRPGSDSAPDESPGWLPVGRRAWVMAGACWLLIALLRVATPAMTPAGSPVPTVPLDRVWWVLRDTGMEERANPDSPGRNDALKLGTPG